MIRLILCAAAFVACLTVPASADEDVMAGFYGNTAVATGGMAETRTSYSADHTFSMRVPMFGVEFKGKWQLSGDQLCRNFDSPPPGITNPLCMPAAAHKVGDTWTLVGDTPRTFKLVKGIQ